MPIVMAAVNPLDNPRAFDKAQIGILAMPGFVDIKIERGQKVDIKDAAGTDGASETDKGIEPAKVKITITIWTPAHWAALPAVMQYLAPTPGKKNGREPKALVHPYATLMRVASIKVLKVHSPKKRGRTRIWDIEVDAIEFFPEAKRTKGVTKTPTKADQIKSVIDHVAGTPGAPDKELQKLIDDTTKYHQQKFDPDPYYPSGGNGASSAGGNL